MRLIDADKLTDEIKTRCKLYCKESKAYCKNVCKIGAILDDIAEAQTIEALVERPAGKWVCDPKSLWDLAHCSKCGELTVGYSKANYCPNCGAKMA